MGLFSELARQGAAARGHVDPHARASAGAAYAARKADRENRVTRDLAIAIRELTEFGRSRAELRGDYQDAFVLSRLVVGDGGQVTETEGEEPQAWETEAFRISRIGSGLRTRGFEVMRIMEEME